MSPLRLVTIALLVSLFSTMGGVLGTYNQIQTALSLEGNNLYSSQSVDVDEKPSTIRDALEKAGANARVFRDLTNDGTVRAVMEFGRPSPLPLHSGRQLGSGGDRGALVGADVRVTTDKGRKSYVFKDHHRARRDRLQPRLVRAVEPRRGQPEFRKLRQGQLLGSIRSARGS